MVPLDAQLPSVSESEQLDLTLSVAMQVHGRPATMQMTSQEHKERARTPAP